MFTLSLSPLHVLFRPNSGIKMYPGVEFNVTEVLSFPDDVTTLLLSLDRDLDQDLVEQCVF